MVFIPLWSRKPARDDATARARGESRTRCLHLTKMALIRMSFTGTPESIVAAPTLAVQQCRPRPLHRIAILPHPLRARIAPVEACGILAHTTTANKIAHLVQLEATFAPIPIASRTDVATGKLLPLASVLLFTSSHDNLPLGSIALSCLLLHFEYSRHFYCGSYLGRRGGI